MSPSSLKKKEQTKGKKNYRKKWIQNLLRQKGYNYYYVVDNNKNEIKENTVYIYEESSIKWKKII